MVTKKIKYHDMDGDLREDDFYFSMNETQFARVNAMFPGGLQAFALKAAKDKKMERLLATLADMPPFSYVIFVTGDKADKRRKLYNGMIKCQVYMYFK